MNEVLKKNIKDLYDLCDELCKRGFYKEDLRARLKLELTFLLLALESRKAYNDQQYAIFKDYILEEIHSQKDLDMVIHKANVRNIQLLSFEEALECVKVFKQADLYLEDLGLKTSLYEAYFIIITSLANLYIEALDFDDIESKKKMYNLLAEYLHQCQMIKVTPIQTVIQNQSSNETLNDLLEQLNTMIGLDIVKQEVNNRINMIKMKKLREAAGIKTPPISLHMVFSGNPGTGKTTVARLVSKIYKELGVLSSGHIVEVDRSGLVGKYIGHTEAKVKEVVENAMGGVLFIDEAYSLSVGRKDDDFGVIAVDTLLKLMEDHRDNLVVIVAGYSDKMKQFIYESNEGLASRFNTFIEFEDYNPKELIMMFDLICQSNDYFASSEAVSYLWDYFDELYKQRDESFSNGRLVRNLFEKIIVNQTNRVVCMNNPTVEDMMSITIDDVKDIL